jgi:hypothetical protein
MSPGTIPSLVAVRNQICRDSRSEVIKVEPTHILSAHSPKESPNRPACSNSISAGKYRPSKDSLKLLRGPSRITKSVQKAAKLDTILEEPLEESLEEPFVEPDIPSPKPVKTVVGPDLKSEVLWSTLNSKQKNPPVQPKTEEYVILRKAGQEGAVGRGLPKMEPMEIAGITSKGESGDPIRPDINFYTRTEEKRRGCISALCRWCRK